MIEFYEIKLHEGVIGVGYVASQHTDESVWLVLNNETHVWLFCCTWISIDNKTFKMSKYQV